MLPPSILVPSILVIDDEPDNFDVVETLLHHDGYRLNYASSGQRALDHLESFQPDVILLDVMMPDLDGLEVCRRIKALPQWRTVPIIMVTALTAKEELSRCLSAGADDFISKPMNGTELRARVCSMLRIKRQYDELQELLKLREDLVNMVVHDLRNPLTSMLFGIEILRLPGFSVEEQREKLEQIAIAGQQLHSLIDSLLLLAKLESGKMLLDCTDLDLNALCTAAVADVEPIAMHKHLTIISHLPSQGRIYADAILLRRMLDNLLSNAIKFSPARSTIQLQVEYLRDGGAQVRVIDSGPGIRPELRQRIFEKYEIGTTLSGVTQIGLGLAFCKLAIEAHGGEITIEDHHPKGTIFTLKLPG